ncbi:MAG: hypothetical protein LBC18_09195 [Opitutaceae bacterium]|nr:hypothetical protein [Opitutaceae bacterium]
MLFAHRPDAARRARKTAGKKRPPPPGVVFPTPCIDPAGFAIIFPGIRRPPGPPVRAVAPGAADAIFFTPGAHRLYLPAALLAFCAWLSGRGLPQPEK